MRFSLLKINERVLSRSAAVFLIGSVAAGCSSNAMRFTDGIDGIFTASTDNQRSIMHSGNQSYPGDLQAAPAGTVSRGSLAPAPSASSVVATSSLPPAQQQAAAAPAPSSPAGAVAPRPAQQPAATRVAEANAAREATAPVEKVPVPARAPTDNVAVLPQNPKAKEVEASKPQAAATANGAGSYTVQPGDTLSSISRKTGVSTTALKSANGMNDGLIRVGQTLAIPSGSSVQAASAKPAQSETATTASAAPVTKPAGEQVTGYTPPKKTDKAIEDVEQQAAVAPDATGIGRMRWPVRGRVIAPYGARSGGKANDGIDISVPEGTSVRAAENGVVIYAGDGLKEFGNTVLVRHEDGLVTVYGHASELKVVRGEKVKRGQEIARSGMSGSADTPKLHFEVRKNSSPVDPSKFLE